MKIKTYKRTQFYMLNKRIFIPLVFVICFINNGFAQEEEDTIGTEVVNVVKPYTPTISDAFKVKEMPVLNDSVSNTKKEVDLVIKELSAILAK